MYIYNLSLTIYSKLAVAFSAFNCQRLLMGGRKSKENLLNEQLNGIINGGAGNSFCRL